MMAAKDLSASFHQRILNKASTSHRPFNELLKYYANERFLYRVSQSPYCRQFVLKGAFVLLAWQIPLTRPTRDLDFLGFTENSVENLVQIVQEICNQPVDPDGMRFDPGTVVGQVINAGVDYPGVRINFRGFLGRAVVHMRLDVGFADTVTPSPGEMELPTILVGMKKPCIRAYPPETVIAEKFHAMVSRGQVNSRMKDYYDLWYVAMTMEFDLHQLKTALHNTFTQRKTPIPAEIPAALSSDFSIQKQPMWTGFRRKNLLSLAPENLSDVVDLLATFFTPLISNIDPSITRWISGMGWEESEGACQESGDLSPPD